MTQSVFERVVARAQSSTRTTAVFGAMFGVVPDEKFLGEYEVANSDPYSAAVGTLIDYDPKADEFSQLDPVRTGVGLGDRPEIGTGVPE